MICEISKKTHLILRERHFEHTQCLNNLIRKKTAWSVDISMVSVRVAAFLIIRTPPSNHNDCCIQNRGRDCSNSRLRLWLQHCQTCCSGLSAIKIPPQTQALCLQCGVLPRLWCPEQHIVIYYPHELSLMRCLYIIHGHMRILSLILVATKCYDPSVEVHYGFVSHTADYLYILHVVCNKRNMF